MLLCPNCRLRGYCQRMTVHLVTDEEMENPEFIRDVKALAFEQGKRPAEWLEHLDGMYQRYYGWIRGRKDREVFLDMEEFDRNFIDDWFERFCCTPLPADKTPRVKTCAKERVRIVATILRATYPARALMWGVRAANTDGPPPNF